MFQKEKKKDCFKKKNGGVFCFFFSSCKNEIQFDADSEAIPALNIFGYD